MVREHKGGVRELRSRTVNTCSPIGRTIQLLLDDGFVPEGLTVEEGFRIPKRDSPLFHTAGEELSKLGTRVRLVKTGTDIRATVGMRSTALFIRAGDSIDGVGNMQSVDTADVREIQAYLEYLKCVDRG